jgi:hypothetical protein
MTDAGHGLCQRRGKLAGAFPVALQQVKSNSLRRFLPDAGHAAKPLNQAYEQG